MAEQWTRTVAVVAIEFVATLQDVQDIIPAQFLPPADRPFGVVDALGQCQIHIGWRGDTEPNGVQTFIDDEAKDALDNLFAQDRVEFSGFLCFDSSVHAAAVIVKSAPCFAA